MTSRKNSSRINNIHSVTTSSYRPEKIQLSKSATKRPKRSPWKRMTVLILLIVILIAATLAIWNFRNFSVASKRLFGTDNAWEVLQTTPLKQDSDGRTNILLIGYSIDNPGHGGADLTDSILILSMDHQSQTGYMLSVPRDLYVNIPEYGYGKINEAYKAGESMNHLFGQQAGGIGLLSELLKEITGIGIHYHAIVNYTAVTEIVDALGGIEVTIDSPDKRGIFDPNFPPEQGGPLKLTNGKHRIDGQTALRLTRARGSTYGSYGFPRSDFNRTQNQQQVLSAIKARLGWGLVLDPRTNGEIFTAAGNNLQTNISIHEVIPVYRLLTKIPEDKMKTVTMNDLDGKDFLAGYTTPHGASALIPAAGIDNYSEIKQQINQLHD